jgi:hypothetical protein
LEHANLKAALRTIVVTRNSFVAGLNGFDEEFPLLEAYSLTAEERLAVPNVLLV